MSIQSDDGRLLVKERLGGGLLVDTDLSEQQVFDALLPLLPPPVPTARDVAEAFLYHLDQDASTNAWIRTVDLTRRWDQGGQP